MLCLPADASLQNIVIVRKNIKYCQGGMLAGGEYFKYTDFKILQPFTP